MNRNTTIATVALSVLVGIGGVSFAIKATNQKKNVENENRALRQQLAGLQNQPTLPDPEKITEVPATGTNAIVALNVPASNTPEATTPEATERPQRESFEDRMARMKEEDPEGYAERIKRREEFQEKMKYNLAERTATFMDLDTSSMNEKELAAHEQLVGRMGTIWDLMEQMQNPEEMNREAMGELFREAREVRPLMEQERATMFRLLGEDLGYTGQDSKDFASHIDRIISSTSLRMPGGGRGGRGH